MIDIHFLRIEIIDKRLTVSYSEYAAVKMHFNNIDKHISKQPVVMFSRDVGSRRLCHSLRLKKKMRHKFSSHHTFVERTPAGIVFVLHFDHVEDAFMFKMQYL